MSVMTLMCAILLSLDGSWKLDYWPQPVDGAVRELPLPAGLAVKSVPAKVPGNCELDLVAGGVLPEPEVGMNARRLREFEGMQWLYSRSFEYEPSSDAGRVELVFDGIDTLADVFLNGVKVGEAENMFVPHRFDVTRALKPGANKVEVLLRSAFYEAQRHDVGELGYHMGFADNEPLRKAAHMGGWDIFPRIYCAGLWRGVRLERIPAVTVDNVAWMFGNFNRDFTWCDAKVQFRVKGPASAFAWGGKVRATLSLGGRERYSQTREYVAVQNELRVQLDHPALWWPKGMGEASLYDAAIEVLDAEGRVLASDARKVGVRLVQLERDDVYSEERPGQFLFRVNGEPCYIRGSNWVPLDAFHGRDRARMIPTLELFEDLNCNMVRVWGGGVYEPDAFFDWCDAHGLMVWQDFMTGCSVFPQDDRYAAITADEVRQIVLRLRNHPSLALWSGNNENDQAGGFGWGAQREFVRDCNLDRNSRRTIPDVLFEYDVTRPYLPSSPYVSSDVKAGLARPSEDHLWGPREYYKAACYTNASCWFASEMGYHGCTSRVSLERMMTKDCVYPWKGSPAAFEKDHTRLDWNDEWRLKASDPYMRGSAGLWKRNDLMTNQIRLMFGGVDTDLDTFIAQSQFIQAEAMKTFCELFRSRKFTRFNGLIWWNVRDGWPQISDAVVDWYGEKKLAYHALKNAQRDQIACVVDDHSAWAVNDAMRPVKGTVKITDAETGEVRLESSFVIPANGKVKLGVVRFEGQGALRIEASFDGSPYRGHFLYGEPPFKWADVRRWIPEGV